MIRVKTRRLRQFLRNIINEVNEYSWEHADDKNLMLSREPGMEKRDRDNVRKYLRSLKLMK